MEKLQYNIHILLYSRYKILINLFVYISILLVSNIYFNNVVIIECMNQNPSGEDPIQIAPRPTNLFEHLYNLEHEISLLRARIDLLERGLSYNLEQRLTERAHYESLLRIATTDIQELRNNLHDSYQTIANSNRLINRLMQENTTLRNMLEQDITGYNTDVESNSSSDIN